MKYDITKIKQIFKEHELNQFEVVDVVTTNDNGTLIHVREIEKKQTLAEHCRRMLPKKIMFKSNNEVYEIEKFYINIQGQVKIVFALKKNDKILNILSLYECEYPNLFSNYYLDMKIDVLIEED